MTIVPPVAFISIDDANTTSLKTYDEKTLRANQECTEAAQCDVY